MKIKIFKKNEYTEKETDRIFFEIGAFLGSLSTKANNGKKIHLNHNKNLITDFESGKEILKYNIKEVRTGILENNNIEIKEYHIEYLILEDK
ncbi:MAG TPA: hypothetical protein PLS10_10845 [Chitinophagales bacterium]|nr:hypothetical protein [Chitinophagales bacterium]